MYMSGGQNYLLHTRNGHGQSEWSPIGCDGLYFHVMCENRVSASVSGWSPIVYEGVHTVLNIPSPHSPLSTTLLFS